jgi:hypothetical protein
MRFRAFIVLHLPPTERETPSPSPSIDQDLPVHRHPLLFEETQE